MRFKRMWVHKHFFQSKMVLDIPKRVEDMDKPKEVEQDANLEEAMNLNWSTGYTDSGNTRPRFSKSKVKCNNGKKYIYKYTSLC